MKQKADYREGPDKFEVFEPFSRNKRNAPVDIMTYGITDVSTMEWVGRAIPRGSRLIVGYSKTSHHPGVLYNRLKEWAAVGVQVRVLPAFHSKMWIISGRGYCGSANFVPSTLVNYMHPAKSEKLQRVFDMYWEVAHNPFRRGTDLLKLPQTRKRMYFK